MVLHPFRYYLSRAIALVATITEILRLARDLLHYLLSVSELYEGYDLATRTYLIQLYAVMHLLYRYMTKWQTKITPQLTSEQAECFTAVLAAITECLPLILPPDPVE